MIEENDKPLMTESPQSWHQIVFAAALFLIGALTGAPPTLLAASITWSKPTVVVGDADVCTNGVLLYAYDDANVAATVNTVPFSAGNSSTTLGGNVTLASFYWYSTSAFGSGAGSPWNGLSTNYQSVLQGGVYAENGVTTTVTLSSLTLGHAYLVQVWSSDSRSLASNRTETVTSAGGNAVTLDYNNTGTNGGVGQYSIGAFTADSTTQMFTLTGVLPAGGNSAQLNAIQVRDQGALITWSAPATITGDADVATNGVLLYAYDESNAGATVNGVTFLAGNSDAALGGNVALSGFYAVDNGSFGSGAGSPWNGLSPGYQTVLRGGAWANNSNTVVAMTLNNLVVGHAYLVQVWANDDRSYGAGRTETVSSSAGNTVTLAYNSLNAAGGVGQYTIGSFTAGSAAVLFTMTGNVTSQLNAIQVRDQTIVTNYGVISLTPAITYQQMYGIGGNFCQGDQNTLIGYGLTNQVFSPQGLNLSFIRLGNTYGLTESQFTNMAAYNNPVMAAFRAMQPNGTVLMSAWSPPENLKSTGSAYKGTLAKVNGQYVYTNYANWWLNSLQYYQSNSSLPDYITIQNEPNWYPSGSTNYAYNAGCELDAVEGGNAGYPEALAAVVGALQSNGLQAVKIAAPDIEYIRGNIVPQYFANAPSGRISAIAHHLYGDNAATTGVSLLTQFESEYPYTEMPKFMSEMNPGDNLGTNEPDYMGLAVTMHNVFTFEDANTYAVWSIMWGLIYPPTGLPVSDNYYALGHFSKFIQPGDWRVSVASTDTNVLASLYLHHTGPGVFDRLTLVLINSGGNYDNSVVNISTNWALDPLQRSWQVYQTANAGSRERLTLVASMTGAGLTNNQNLVLPPYSITTAVINTGVLTNAPPTFISNATNSVINPGQTFEFTNAATDPDLPAQTLAFSLLTAPAGASVNATNGILVWRPLIAQAKTTNRFSVVVTDNGFPSLSATQSFTVTVRSVTVPQIFSPNLSRDQFFVQVSGSLGPDYILQASSNLVIWANLLTTNPISLPFTFVDRDAGNLVKCFYRVLLGP